MSFPDFSIRSKRSDRPFVKFHEEFDGEIEGKFSFLDETTILRIFHFLNDNLKATPLVCKKWNQLLFGPFYQSLYIQKKPFGVVDWIHHFKINPGPEPIIPILKLVNFDPAVGSLTLIVTRYKAANKRKNNKVRELSLFNIFCCSLIAKQNQESPYKYTPATQRRFFDERSKYLIEDLAPKTGNYWAYTPFPDHHRPWNHLNALFHIPLKHSRKMDASLPYLMGILQTFITYHARTGSYSFGNVEKGMQVIVKETLALRPPLALQERLFHPYKLCVGFSERGISIASVGNFSSRVNKLAFIESEMMGIPPTIIDKVVKKIRKIRKGSTI